MKLLTNQWVKGKVPLANGIFEAKGRSHLVLPADPPRYLPMTLKVIEHSNASNLTSAEWTTALPCQKVMDNDSGYVAVVGECGMGSDGFLALQAMNQPESLIWLAFFDFSNPFELVYIEDNFIKAHNNMGEEWWFPLLFPWKVEIKAAPNGNQ